MYAIQSEKCSTDSLKKKQMRRIFIIILLLSIDLFREMCGTTCEKIKRRCEPFTYAFSPSHLKSVLIGMVTEYESK